MLFMLFVLVLLGYTSLAKSSLGELPVHPGVGGLYKGPNSETIIKGPDGSVITAQQEGGSILTDTAQPIVVADTLEAEVDPIVSAVPLSSQPAVVAAPIGLQQVNSVVPAVSAVLASSVGAVPVGHTIEVIQPDPHIIETEIVDAPLVEPQQSTDLVGPSGSISTRGSSSIVSGPASTTISEPARVLIATPLVAAIPVVATATTPLRAISISTPLISSAAPPVDVSSTPNILSTLAPPLAIVSTTAAPPPVWEDNDINTISTPASGLIITRPIGSQNIGASVQLASSNGFVNNPVQISSTPRPEIVLSSTSVPSFQGVTVSAPVTDWNSINNRQLGINPSLIPSANIIPPEIGPLPPGAIDLGTTVTVSTTPRASGISPASESSNIQRISNENSVLLNNKNLRNIDGRVSDLGTTSVRADGRLVDLGTNQVSAHNQIVFSGNGQLSQPVISTPLSKDSIPVGIPRNGIVGSQLENYGIDSSQIDLTNVPLSSVSSFPQSLDRDIDDVSVQLWNRYSRHVKEKKIKNTKITKDE